MDRVTIPEPGGPDEFIYEVVMRDGEIDLVPVSTEEIAGRAVNFPENPDSASVGDIVVYGTDGWSVWCAMEQAELGNAWTSDQTIKARGYMGVSNLNATYAWLDTWSNNASWNQQYDRQFPYYPGPTLILVGDTEIIPPLTYDDNETEECQMPDCVTDMAFTDYWHTGPWALVQRIPSETNPELWTACENANTWNQGIHDAGVIERKATFFCGNTMWGVEQEGF